MASDIDIGLSSLPDDQEILASEFCAGYTDILGNWNSGFYCPNGESSDALFCCGTATFKYCCLRREHVSTKDLFGSLPILLGIIFIVVAAIGIVTIFVLAACCICPCCLLYKKRQQRFEPGPLYRLQCNSTASGVGSGVGVANMYSFSTQNSMATTPTIECPMSHTELLMDFETTNGDMSPGIRNNGRKTMTLGHTFSSEKLQIPVKRKSVGFAVDVEYEDSQSHGLQSHQMYTCASSTQLTSNLQHQTSSVALCTNSLPTVRIQDSTPRDAPLKEFSPREILTKEPLSRDPFSKDPLPRDVSSRDTLPRGIHQIEAIPRESSAKRESIPRELSSRDSLPRDIHQREALSVIPSAKHHIEKREVVKPSPDPAPWDDTLYHSTKF